jgi:hypothetical protein
MRTRLIVTSCAVFLVLSGLAASEAFARQGDDVHLQVCNKGSVPVEFVLASQELDANDLSRGPHARGTSFATGL